MERDSAVMALSLILLKEKTNEKDTHKLLLNNMKFYKKHGYCWTVATHGYWGAISIAPPELCELNPEMSNR